MTREDFERLKKGDAVFYYDVAKRKTLRLIVDKTIQRGVKGFVICHQELMLNSKRKLHYVDCRYNADTAELDGIEYLRKLKKEIEKQIVDLGGTLDED